jgi:hypothetical protein
VDPGFVGLEVCTIFLALVKKKFTYVKLGTKVNTYLVIWNEQRNHNKLQILKSQQVPQTSPNTLK